MDEFMSFADSGTSVGAMGGASDAPRASMDMLSTSDAPPTVSELQSVTGAADLPPSDNNLELFRKGLESGLYKVRPQDNPGLDRKQIEQVIKKTMQQQQALENKKLSMRVGFKLDSMPLSPLLPLPRAYTGTDGKELNKELNAKAFADPSLYRRGVRRPFWNTGYNVGVTERLVN